MTEPADEIALATPHSPRSGAGYLDLVRRNRDFRWLWLGQLVSLLGDWFNLIASATLVAHYTHSELAVGTLFVVRMLSHFAASPAAGVVADRYDRRLVLVGADLLRVVVVLGFLWVDSGDELWLLYALTAVQLGAGGFFYAARNAVLPDLVAARDLGTANALSAATWSVMLAVGAALGGVVAGAFGTDTAFLVDAASFGVSALCILRVTATVAGTGGARTFAAALAEYLDGLRYLRDHVDIFVISLNKACAFLVLGASFHVVQIAIAERVFPIGEGGGTSVGLLFALGGVGTGFGPIVARIFTGDRERALRHAIVLAYFIGAAGLLVCAPLGSFALVLLGCVLAGLGQGIIWVFSTQLLLQRVPGHVRGRVFATEFALFTLASAAGAASVGALQDAGLGISAVLVVMAAVVMLPGIGWFAWVKRGLGPSAA